MGWDMNDVVSEEHFKGILGLFAWHKKSLPHWLHLSTEAMGCIMDGGVGEGLTTLGSYKWGGRRRCWGKKQERA